MEANLAELRGAMEKEREKRRALADTAKNGSLWRRGGTDISLTRHGKEFHKNERLRAQKRAAMAGREQKPAAAQQNRAVSDTEQKAIELEKKLEQFEAGLSRPPSSTPCSSRPTSRTSARGTASQGGVAASSTKTDLTPSKPAGGRSGSDGRRSRNKPSETRLGGDSDLFVGSPPKAQEVASVQTDTGSSQRWKPSAQVHQAPSYFSQIMQERDKQGKK